MPNVRRSSTFTMERISFSLSQRSFNSASKPIEVFLRSRCLIISSRSGNAPPQIKRIFLVLTVVSGTIAFLLFAPTGTSTSAPSNSFSMPCCTDSPETSREVVLCLRAILSISSIKPCSALSTSLSAAARSLLTTLSMSSPIYPASVREVASAIASGTSRSFASVFTR